MKTQITLTVDSDVKDKFKEIAANVWANMSTLVNMYFTQVVNTWKIEFFYSEKSCTDSLTKVECEKFSEKEKKDLESLPNFSSFVSASSWK